MSKPGILASTRRDATTSTDTYEDEWGGTAGSTAASVAWAELEVPEASASASVAWAELEVPAPA